MDRISIRWLRRFSRSDRGGFWYKYFDVVRIIFSQKKTSSATMSVSLDEFPWTLYGTHVEGYEISEGQGRQGNERGL
jgi:hypothetical protein